MDYNGKKVILNDNYNNAAISVHLLSEDEMRKAGFTDRAEDRWYYFQMVSEHDISFNLSIPKDDPDGWRIDVLDEDFCQPYDYQHMFSHGSRNPVVMEVQENVEREMRRLADLGIISGHEVGDYI